MNLSSAWRRSWCLLLTGSVCILLAGCGAEEYERRLGESVKLMQYYALLDDHLAQVPWRERGISFRPPRQFRMIAPPDHNPADGTAGPPDPRQPDFFPDGAELPGLAGAWQAEVTGQVAGEPRQLPAYLYVLSNYDLWLRSETHQAAEAFFDTAVSHLCHGLDVAPPREERWLQDALPRGQGYVPKKPFLTTIFDPRPVIHGAEYDVTLYLHQAEDMRTVIVFLVPQGADFKIPAAGDALELSLETLEVSPERPSLGATGGGGGGGGGSVF